MKEDEALSKESSFENPGETKGNKRDQPSQERCEWKQGKCRKTSKEGSSEHLKENDRKRMGERKGQHLLSWRSSHLKTPSERLAWRQRRIESSRECLVLEKPLTCVGAVMTASCKSHVKNEDGRKPGGGKSLWKQTSQYHFSLPEGQKCKKKGHGSRGS